MSENKKKPKTVRCRIALVVDEDGGWTAAGESRISDDDAFGCIYSEGVYGARHIITVEVPIPEVREIEGTVEEVE